MYTNIVFAGGGNRCFWQAGFYEIVSQQLSLAPKHIASVSAGAAISCAIFADRVEETIKATVDVQGRNEKNRYWKRALKGKNVHPHSELYREIIHQAIDMDALHKLKSGPENRILLAELPSWLGPRLAVLFGLGAYQIEKKLFQPVHPAWGRKLGFRSTFVAANTCSSVDELADLILCSSCTPPFTPVMRHRQTVVLDGGMVDNVPRHGIEEQKGKTLILLSRPYKQLPPNGEVVYVAPSRKVEASAWDYTSPEKVLATYHQGKQDAEVFLTQLRR